MILTLNIFLNRNFKLQPEQLKNKIINSFSFSDAFTRKTRKPRTLRRKTLVLPVTLVIHFHSLAFH